ncbi:hypothetical protein M413DRAFT_375314 [Hebeloma cylindrosporum]|uniref:Uncharacterized protein n=1 Tax=Hebeloma cylindrosporum TaxID=76867 RepID=A0A0C3CJ79_HEBCY|nr:hypothetical protein M413DRAFT_375314 [Hebeloma cylindrosporum h7]
MVSLRSHPPFYLIRNDPLEWEKVAAAQAIEKFLALEAPSGSEDALTSESVQSQSSESEWDVVEQEPWQRPVPTQKADRHRVFGLELVRRAIYKLENKFR